MATATMQEKTASAERAALCGDCESFVPIGVAARGKWSQCPYCKLHFQVETVYNKRRESDE